MTTPRSIATLLRADEALAPDADTLLHSIRQGVAIRRRRRRSLAIGAVAVAAAAAITVPSLVRLHPEADTQAASLVAAPAVSLVTPAVSLVTAPAAPSWFAETISTVPAGWQPYTGSANKTQDSLYSSDAVPVTDYRQLITLSLTEDRWTPGTLTDTVAGKPGLVRSPIDGGGWVVIVEQAGGLRAGIQFPAALDDLTRAQVVTIAESLVVRDSSRLAVG